VDISIQPVSGGGPGSQCQPMFENWVQPVCGPPLLETRTIASVDDLRGVRLLRSQNRRGDWQEWMTAVGYPDFPLDQADIVEFSNSLLAYQAAMDGLGVVIGHLPLLRPDLAAGRLVPVLDPPIRQGSYYAVWRTDRGRVRKARKFLAWLQRQLDLTAAPPAAVG
jgi:LysR family glycine cleavage system transcriptional activator